VVARFPVLLKLRDSRAGNYINFYEETLPRGTTLKAEVRSFYSSLPRLHHMKTSMTQIVP